MSKQSYYTINILLAICLIFVYVFYVNTSLSERITRSVYDYIVSSESPETVPDDIVVITIDDASIQRFNKKWPWPRTYHAELIDLLTTADAKVIAYNILFLEESILDIDLLEAIRRSNQYSKRLILPVSDEIGMGNNIFSRYAQSGHVSSIIDSDGIMRSIKLFEDFNGMAVPSFALRTLLYTNPTLYHHYVNQYGPDSVHYDKPTQFVYSGRERFRSYSFFDVINRNVPLETFKNKIVFVGVTATGVGERFIPAHRDRRTLSGLEVQVNFFEALRKERLVKQVSENVTFVANLFAMVLLVFILRSRRVESPVNNLLGLVFAFSLVFITYIIFRSGLYWLNFADTTVIGIGFVFIYTLSSTHYRLREANRSLEAHVEARTQELRQTNLSLAQEVKERGEIELSLRHSEHGLRILLDSIQIGIITTNPNGRVITANKTAFSLLGLEADEVGDLYLQEVLTYSVSQGSGKIDVEPLIGELKDQNSSIQVEGEVLSRKNGEKTPVAINFSQLHRGGMNKYVCLIRDIQDQRRAEKMTQEFVATVSHELRTPITSVKGSLELIYAGVAGELTPKTRQLLSLALRNSDRLLLLVNDILDVQRIQLGTLEFNLKPVDIVSAVKQSIEVNEAYAATYDAMLLSDLPTYPLYVLGDYDRITQVMSNLISNATKFSNKKGAIVDIVVRLVGDKVEVSVQDYGAGIPESFQDKVFGKFTQADEAKHRSQGTGLGLSITKALVERMSGTIDFESVEGEGTIFFFKLPILTPLEMRRIEEGKEFNEDII